MSFNEFIEMGNHGFYVWTCYGVTLLIFVGLFLSVHIQNRKTLQQLKRRYRSEELNKQKAVTDKSKLADNDSGVVNQ